MTRSAPRTKANGPVATISIRLPEGTKLRADVAALRNGKSLSAMIADVVVKAFAQPSPLDAIIASLAAREYDVDAPGPSRRPVLQAYRADAVALLEAVDAEIAKAKSDTGAFVQRLKEVSEEVDANLDIYKVIEPGEE